MKVNSRSFPEEPRDTRVTQFKAEPSLKLSTFQKRLQVAAAEVTDTSKS